MSNLTKKNYEAIADCIEYRLCARDNHPHEIAKRLADYFAQDNPKFNRIKFLEACGIEHCRHEYNDDYYCHKCSEYSELVNSSTF